MLAGYRSVRVIDDYLVVMMERHIYARAIDTLDHTYSGSGNQYWLQLPDLPETVVYPPYAYTYGSSHDLDWMW